MESVMYGPDERLERRFDPALDLVDDQELQLPPSDCSEVGEDL
jgi:hypothetical protein